MMAWQWHHSLPPSRHAAPKTAGTAGGFLLFLSYNLAFLPQQYSAKTLLNWADALLSWLHSFFFIRNFKNFCLGSVSYFLIVKCKNFA